MPIRDLTLETLRFAAWNFKLICTGEAGRCNHEDPDRCARIRELAGAFMRASVTMAISFGGAWSDANNDMPHDAMRGLIQASETCEALMEKIIDSEDELEEFSDLEEQAGIDAASIMKEIIGD